MTDISRAALFGKLAAFAYKTIETATVFCKLRGNPHVELAHWIHQILRADDSDLHRISRHFDLDASALAADVIASLDRLPRGASSVVDLSSWVESAVERGWVYSSLMFEARQVRTGHLVLGMLKTRPLRHALVAISKQFERIKIDELADDFDKIVDGSPEGASSFPTDSAPAASASGSEPAPGVMGKQEALKKYAVDLTARARAGEIDPVAGRDEEIRQLIDILMRRRQNNPLLTGEAGVGKTAVVEGFALRIARGDVPPALKEIAIHALDIGLLSAGASMKGEFESRLRAVIDEVQSSPKPIILFIDEAHTLIGAGGASGTGDAANLLKPALARGKLRTIAATTWAEYKKHIEKDPALTRRFQVVQIEEPSEEKTVLMLRGVAAMLEAHHGVALLDEAIEAAVRLSHRYIPARQLPDKAVSLLDTACARVAVSQHATPAALEDSTRRLEALRLERSIIEREALIGIDVGARKARTDLAIDAETRRLASLELRHRDEKQLAGRVLKLRATLRKAGTAVEGAAPAAADQDIDRPAVLAELVQAQHDLHALQGDAPLILAAVDAQAVGSVVQDWTGIPVGRMVKNEIESVLNLAQTLDQRVIGQSHALETIARRIQTSRARLDNPNKPVGVFMLAGTSGVGKTETALALADAIYGGEHNVITINMSEYQEAHTVSSLKGAPPGYVGYGEGGVLTEAVRRKPYSVILLDEVEKAHPDVHELFFQVFDKGWMEDGEGRSIDFKNTVILLTTNVGSDLLMSMCRDPARLPDVDTLGTALRKPLLDVFPAALLGRMVVIPYYPLSDAMLRAIVRLQLERIAKRVQANHAMPFSYDDAVVDLVVSRCNEVESGGRIIDALLTNTVLPRLGHEVLTRLSSGLPMRRMALSVDAGDFSYGFD